MHSVEFEQLNAEENVANSLNITDVMSQYSVLLKSS